MYDCIFQIASQKNCCQDADTSLSSDRGLCLRLKDEKHFRTSSPCDVNFVRTDPNGSGVSIFFVAVAWVAVCYVQAAIFCVYAQKGRIYGHENIEKEQTE